MKKVIFILSLCFSISMYAQEEVVGDTIGDTNLEAIMGTWVYQSNDTIFKIRLSTKCAVKVNGVGISWTWIQVFGSYYLKVGDKVKVDDLDYDRPTTWVGFGRPEHVNIKVYRLDRDKNNYTYGAWFYDLEKKHHGGDGINAVRIKLIAPNKLHWSTHEEQASFESEYPVIGFSVPTDVIMTKEEED